MLSGLDTSEVKYLQPKKFKRSKCFVKKTQRQESWNVEHCNDHLYLLCELTIVA